MKYLQRNFFVFCFLFLLTSCFTSQQKPERLLPPEPVFIKEDAIITQKEASKETSASKPLPSLKETYEPRKIHGSGITSLNESPLPQKESVTEGFLGRLQPEEQTSHPTPQTEEEAQKPIPSWAKSKGDGVYKVGKPYKVNGVWYFPAPNPRYDEIGFASVYPKSFHGKRTANGEIYSKSLLTVSHKTLPLPSVVQVTNLSNNKSVIVRVNDRGPFVNDRLIDLSEKAAELLEASKDTPIKVRVEILNQESKEAASALTSLQKAVLPQPAYPPSVTKETEVTPSLEKDENFVTVQPSVASQEISSEGLFDSNTSSPNPAAEKIKTETQPSHSQEPLAPFEQVNPPSLMPSGLLPPSTPPRQKIYYVQAGVFANPENARNLSDKLHTVGSVEDSSITMNGRLFHRVRVGPFSSLEDANRALAQVKHHDLPDARIITS